MPWFRLINFRFCQTETAKSFRWTKLLTTGTIFAPWYIIYEICLNLISNYFSPILIQIFITALKIGYSTNTSMSTLNSILQTLRFSIILIYLPILRELWHAISSGDNIHSTKFGDYALEKTKQLVRKYHWF